MAKIKITKKQAMMLENLNKPKILKITESQYKAILEHEGLGENVVIPGIHRAISNVSTKAGNEYVGNVNAIAKPGVFKESEELWKEFVNELYGLHESGSSNYERLIKLMEACGYVENRKLSKSKFDGDRDMAKNVILGGLNKLHECGSPYSAMEMMENEYERIKQSLTQQLNKKPTSNTTPEAPVNEYEDNLPMGSDSHPDAPWNQRDTMYGDRINSTNNGFNLLANTGESAIFEKGGELYYFYYGNMNKDDFKEYANQPIIGAEKDEEGFPNYEYGEWEMNDEVISDFLNSNVDNLNVGFGYESYANGADFVKMDEPLKSEILSVPSFKNNPDVVKALGNPIEEVTSTTGALGSTSLVIPLGSKTEDYITKGGIKENAFDRTQWAGGEFVEFDDCTKLNNNKEAQNGGCSTGAVDKVVKTKKTSSNVNAPSLGKKQSK
jgi:hypothetical protein